MGTRTRFRMPQRVTTFVCIPGVRFRSGGSSSMLSFRVLLFLACSLASAQITQPSSGGGDLGVFSYSATNLTLTANTYFFSPGGGAAPSTTETNVDYAS